VGIALRKRIPAGGGLGGGSSDAAAVLAGLRRLWSGEWDAETLSKVAAELGSDVPFFLVGGMALGTGRGEVLEPWPPVPPLDLVLVTPAFGVNTAWAYAARVEVSPQAPSLAAFEEAVRAGTPEAIASVLRNDLEAGVTAQFPEIAAIRAEMLAAGALGARMTGSGSTVYGIARDAAHAQHLAAVLARPDRRSFAVRTLTAAEARPLQEGT
jgi:4-diphosphocytidyl-2-C-methyl-D-erythritol kinase